MAQIVHELQPQVAPDSRYYDFSERLRRRLNRRLKTAESTSTALGMDRKTLYKFRYNANAHFTLDMVDKLVAWLDEQDALDEQDRKGNR